MITFKDLLIGDYYNTKIARCAKINDTQAIVTMSGILAPGTIIDAPPDTEVIVLYSGKMEQLVSGTIDTVKEHIRFKVDARVKANEPDQS